MNHFFNKENKMNQVMYKNYLINNSYSFSGKTMYYNVWKLDEEGNPFDVWGDSFRSIKQAKNFINMEVTQ
jgi:hypothetical protein